jgi:hypothetical protein
VLWRCLLAVGASRDGVRRAPDSLRALLLRLPSCYRLGLLAGGNVTDGTVRYSWRQGEESLPSGYVIGQALFMQTRGRGITRSHADVALLFSAVAVAEGLGGRVHWQANESYGDLYVAMSGQAVAALRASVRPLLPRKAEDPPPASAAQRLSNLHLVSGEQRPPAGVGATVGVVQLVGTDGKLLDVLGASGQWLCLASELEGRPSAQAALRSTSWGDTFLRHVAPALVEKRKAVRAELARYEAARKKRNAAAALAAAASGGVAAFTAQAVLELVPLMPKADAKRVASIHVWNKAVVVAD